MDARRLRAMASGLGFIAPNLTIFLVFTLVPVVFSLALSFFRWDPFGSPTFVGFENFNRLLVDREFWYYMLNTVVLMLGLPLSIAGSLFLAVMMSQKLRGIVAFRTVYYLPTITNGVALFILWKVMFNKEGGLINSLLLPVLQFVGVTVDGHQLTAANLPDWLQQAWQTPHWFASMGLPSEIYLAKPALIMMGVWTAIGGGNMLLYLAALAGVPQDLYEAAEIDGAGKWRRFWDITWPMIAPTTFFIVVMGVIGGLQGGFEMAYLMTQGGPDDSTKTVGYYIFVKAFQDFEFGYAAAISFVLFAVIGTVTWFNWRVGNKAGGY